MNRAKNLSFCHWSVFTVTPFAIENQNQKCSLDKVQNLGNDTKVNMGEEDLGRCNASNGRNLELCFS